ncbi:MAG: mechanosensitive ion channel family protein [Chloroflexota bacterium]|nr:MAG: mechanosensitive ion channel family protein [SAR202 cluster bacterium]MCH2670922.1 mechanosensitive ion channel family protein [Dehalococcoidia bacterium]MED5208177.1 mechanosensitive ion channel family protein [Chloroflexota bacterium]MEE3013182.1 mechanosensitive ion channel family protein [Chloroflexota bacterium]GIS94848.1 MAG: mechanosensitive ion channel protein [Dehalococcoidia bacterium]|tara:strand:+ start:19257 stop:20510 length:1254 start_codon:yes stop_codon:yes gene_type:complete
MDPILARFGLGDPEWLDPATAGVIVLISLVVAFIFHKAIVPITLRFTNWTSTDLDERLVKSIRWPLTLGILSLGAYLAVTISWDLTVTERDRADAIARGLGVVVGITAVVGLISSTIDWYLASLSNRANHVVDLRLFPLIRRVGSVIIYVIGALLVMDVMDINISPLIAGLGLGGLAVALAIQPTLANLFAGTYVMTEGVISTGDYIELEGGMAGYVVEVGWRSTRIRTWGNNLVVVPNARFAETIITNYQQPAPAVNVYVTCGVSYDSDLDHVEKICREVMDDLVQNDSNAIRSYGSWFAFDAFGDSNVDFWLFMQARDRVASFNLQSTLIKNLHREFRVENIIINYPVRTLQFPDGFTPEMLGAIQTSANSTPDLSSRPERLSREARLYEEGGPDIDGVPPGGGESPMGTPDAPM